jgi:hypothetical protein
MSKAFCIFCGKKPASKTKEHVLPKWLITMTAGLKTQGNFGRSLLSPEKQFIFPFDKFTFPSCKECNQRGSILESKAKVIIEKLCANRPLSAADFHILLNWFDKLRIGLWQGYYYLNNNPARIEPLFHIEQRTMIHDRTLSIIKLPVSNVDLSFRGCDQISFFYTPSAFSIIINCYCFINISYPFLISKELGYPYPRDAFLRCDGLVDYLVGNGTGKLATPEVLKLIPFSNTTIMQCIFSQLKNIGGYIYKNNYINNNSMDYDNGIGAIFIKQDDETILRYSDHDSNAWIPKSEYTQSSIHPLISMCTIFLQIFIDSLRPKLTGVSQELRGRMEKVYEQNNQINNKTLVALRDNYLQLHTKA